MKEYMMGIWNVPVTNMHFNRSNNNFCTIGEVIEDINKVASNGWVVKSINVMHETCLLVLYERSL